MDRSDFEKAIQIDPEQLDVECVQQAELFQHWAELEGKAQGEMERLKGEMDTTWARLDLKVRKKPHRYGLENVTEPAVKATVANHPDYLRAVSKYHSARATSLWLDRAVKSLEMKKRMLEELIKLHIAGYFAGPSAPRDLAREWNSRRSSRDRRATEKQRTRLRRRDS